MKNNLFIDLLMTAIMEREHLFWEQFAFKVLKGRVRYCRNTDNPFIIKSLLLIQHIKSKLKLNQSSYFTENSISYDWYIFLHSIALLFPKALL